MNQEIRKINRDELIWKYVYVYFQYYYTQLLTVQFKDIRKRNNHMPNYKTLEEIV